MQSILRKKKTKKKQHLKVSLKNKKKKKKLLSPKLRILEWIHEYHVRDFW